MLNEPNHNYNAYYDFLALYRKISLIYQWPILINRR